jgi:NAD(P)-dependent dehydrogenase (short-subunit alcohol dehydrogenase family)
MNQPQAIIPQPSPQPSGRTIAVTGTSSGIGLATVERLRADGHHVITLGRAGADIEVRLWEPDERARAVREVGDRCGGVLDGVGTFAGVGPMDPDARLVLGLNYYGTTELLEGLRPYLAAAPAAGVVVCGSNVTTHGMLATRLLEACLEGDEEDALDLAVRYGSNLAYFAAKTGLCRWVRRNAVRPEWIGAGISMNVVSPGVTDTPMLRGVMAHPDAAVGFERYPLPIGRRVTPEEMAAVNAYFLGPEARIFCGAVIVADGGSDAAICPDAWPVPPPEMIVAD